MASNGNESTRDMRDVLAQIDSEYNKAVEKGISRVKAQYIKLISYRIADIKYRISMCSSDNVRKIDIYMNEVRRLERQLHIVEDMITKDNAS